MTRIAQAISNFFRMTNEDILAVNALNDVLLKDLILRLVIEVAIAGFCVWVGEPVAGLIWLILIVPGEFLEVILHHFLKSGSRITSRALYGQFAVSIIGGGIWSGMSVYLWTTGNLTLMATGLAMLMGVMMHVIFKYVDWAKAAIVAGIPPVLGFLAVLVTHSMSDVPVSHKAFLIFGVLGLFYYAYIVAAASIRKQIELKKALVKASAASEAKSRFLANMSHEIRTPMNGVLGMADLLERRQMAPDEAEMVGIIRSSGDTLVRIIDDILDISKIEAGRLTLDEEVFCLDDVVKTIVATADMTAQEKNLGFECVYETGDRNRYFGDALRLRQIIGNLLSNAVKFTSQGSIRLILKATPIEDSEYSRLVVSVADTGPGLSEADQKAVFDPFVQVDGSKSRQHGGTGLGLTIARQIAELMGGELSVESELGRGATFTFECQLRRQGAEEAQASFVPSDSFATMKLQDGCPSILIAEDHPLNRRVIELMLNSLHANIRFAENGLQAVEAYKSDQFDLVLMDIQMPGISGIEAFQRIRELEKERQTQPVPIIALTANVMKHQVEEYEEIGFNGYLAKPINIENLFQVVSLVLSDSAEA